MTNKTLGLLPELNNYLLSVSLREADVLKQLREETASHPVARMQIAPEQGQFMALLVKMLGAVKALEIGVFTGYSSTCLALALPPDGKLIACDVSEEYTNTAKKYWKEAGVNDKIELHLRPALETLDELLQRGQAESFDFAFIDADKNNYENYYEKCLQLLRPGGLIAIDNVLWSGRVLNEIPDKMTQSIMTFNRKLHADKRVELSLIPIADGLTLALKK